MCILLLNAGSRSFKAALMNPIHWDWTAEEGIRVLGFHRLGHDCATGRAAETPGRPGVKAGLLITAAREDSRILRDVILVFLRGLGNDQTPADARQGYNE